MKNYYVLLFIVIFSFHCKEDPAPPVLSKKDHLVQKPWKLVTAEVKINNGPWQIQNAAWPSCQTDNEWIFLTIGKMRVTEGATKCFSSDPQLISESDWVLSTDETKMMVTSGTTVLDWVIDKLTADEFLSTTTSVISGDTYYVKRQMKH